MEGSGGVAGRGVPALKASPMPSASRSRHGGRQTLEGHSQWHTHATREREGERGEGGGRRYTERERESVCERESAIERYFYTGQTT